MFFKLKVFVAPMFSVLLALSPCLCASAQSDTPTQSKGIEWQKGPVKAQLGGVATIDVPKGYQFSDGIGARRLMELNQNPTNGDEVGVLMPSSTTRNESGNWVMLFEFHEVGFVSDTEKDQLDSDSLLESIKKGTEQANETRKEKGWTPFHVIGWSRKPFFDDRTKNLTWAITGREENAKAGEDTINYSVRLLGRRGTMSVDLISDPQQLQQILPRFDSILAVFSFSDGNRYSEFVKGDKVASYGLTALIAGGATAVAVKTGLFAKVLKVLVGLAAALWKVIAIVLAGIAAKFRALGSWLRGLFSSKRRRGADSDLGWEQRQLGSGDNKDDLS